MKNSIIIIWLTIFLTLFSCKTEKKNGNIKFDEKDISKTWKIFLNIIESKNKEDFKNISNEKIRCYLCLENTLNEQLEIENLRTNDSLWYDKIYDDLIYIPIDHFLNNDFDLIFTPAFVSILKVKKTKFLKTNIDGTEYYEILVTTTEPTLNDEGEQHNFYFKKINGKWKFHEIETIP